MGDNKFPAGKVITKGDLLMEQKNNDEMYDEFSDDLSDSYYG